MIIFIGPRRQTDRIAAANKLGVFPHMVVKTYSWLYRTRRLPAATYVFLTIDRMDMFEKRLAGKFYTYINRLGPGFRALNNPALGLGRLPLLRLLNRAGINDFKASLAVEQIAPERFPVFVRRHTMSVPPLTGLIHTQEELASTLARLVAEGEPPEDLLITELCPELVDGRIYVRRSAYRMGDIFYLSYNLYHTDWYNNVGKRDVVPETEHAKELAYMQAGAELPAIRRAFEIANIEYGRTDFAMVNQRPQFFEINFNPWMGLANRAKFEDHPQRSASIELADERRIAALKAIDGKQSGSAPTLDLEELLRFRLMPWRNYAPERY